MAERNGVGWEAGACGKLGGPTDALGPLVAPGSAAWTS
jgi:hypothetical protein